MANKYTIELTTGNSAFEENEGMEVARILRKLADSIEQGSAYTPLMDINGNKVGEVIIYPLD